MDFLKALGVDSGDAMHAFVLNVLASKGQTEEIKKYLESNKTVDINKGDYDGRVPLHLAAQNGHLQTCKFLVEKGASASTADRWLNTPLGEALAKGHAPVAEFLRQKYQSGTALGDGAAGAASMTDQMKLEQFRAIFDAIQPSKTTPNEIAVKSLEDFLKKKGLRVKHHPLLGEQIKKITSKDGKSITFDSFTEMMKGPETVLWKACHNTLAVANWDEFCATVEKIYNEVKDIKDGKVATYIPELGEADPEWYAISITTVDGQTFHLGESTKQYSIQSCGKPLLYSFAVDDHGYDHVHKFVGKEPSGRVFNAFTLDDNNLPHNACINAGAIAVSALYRKDEAIATRFKTLQSKIAKCAGATSVGFNQAVFLSERATANTNFALAYFMASKGTFPQVKIEDALNFYFQLCSIDITTQQLGVVAATYANYGLCPITGEKCLSFNTVKATLQLMFSCGMYDYS